MDTLTKSQAVALFGGRLRDLSQALGITVQAVSQWPEQLPLHLHDRVIGAAVRTGKLFPKPKGRP